MLKIKEIFFHSWVRYLICFLYEFVIIIIYNSLRNWVDLINYMDAYYIAGFSLICIGGLSIVNNLGTFDIFTHIFVGSRDGRPKPSLYDYTESKKEKRHKNRFHCVPYFVFGILYILVSVILQACL